MSDAIVKQGLNLISGVAWKIDDAEANAQYMQGTETLRKGVIDFNNSLATDPNPESYLDKWNKQKDLLWKQAQTLVKNPRALDALSRQWASIDENQYGKVTGLQTNARVNRIVLSTDNMIQGIVKDNTRTNSDRKSAVQKALEPLLNIGQVTPEQGVRLKEQYDKQIDANAMEMGLTQIAQAEGWDYATSLVDNADFQKFFPSLGQQDRDAIRAKLETQARFEDAQFKKADEDSNASYDDKITQAYANMIDGRPGGLTTGLILNPNGFSDTPVGVRYKKAWLSTMESWMRQQRSEARAEAKLSAGEREKLASSDANDVITDSDMSLAQKKLRLREVAASNEIPQSTLDRWIARSRMNSNNTTFRETVAKVKAMGKKQPDGSDPTLTPVQVAEISGAMQTAFENNPKITVSEINDRLDQLTSGAKKETTDAWATQLLSEWPRHVSVQGVATMRPKDSPAQMLATKGIKIRSQNGNYYQGDDGKVYSIRTDGSVRWWDGKAWQTLK